MRIQQLCRDDSNPKREHKAIHVSRFTFLEYRMLCTYDSGILIGKFAGCFLTFAPHLESKTALETHIMPHFYSTLFAKCKAFFQNRQRAWYVSASYMAGFEL